MILNFELIEPEYHEAVRAAKRKQSDWYRSLRRAGQAASGIGVGLLLISPRQAVASALLVLFGLFVTCYPWLKYRRTIEDGWKAFVEVGRLTWEASAECLIVRSALAVHRYEWLAFRRFAETRSLFLLYQTGDQPMLLSKRAFLNGEEMNSFRRLLEEKLATPVRGFPVAARSPGPNKIRD